MGILVPTQERDNLVGKNFGHQGMNDLLPEKSRVWRNLEKKSRLFFVTMVLMRFELQFWKEQSCS